MTIEKTNRFRYVKKRAYPSSPCMYPIEYTWMRKPTPVTTRSITAVNWSTCAPTATLKGPAFIHGNSSPLHVSPFQTRANTAHETTNDAARAELAIQCARCPVTPPPTACMAAPSSGTTGTAQRDWDG